MSCLESQLCQIPALLDFHFPYPPWPRCQMEMDMVCRLVSLWHESVRHKNRNLEGKTSVNMLSVGKMWVLALWQRGYRSNLIPWHSPRNGTDGHICSDLPVLSSHCVGMFQSLTMLFFTVRKRTQFLSVLSVFTLGDLHSSSHSASTQTCFSVSC